MQNIKKGRKNKMNIYEIMKRFERKKQTKSVKLVYFVCKLLEKKESMETTLLYDYCIRYYGVTKNTVIKTLKLLEEENLILQKGLLDDTRKRVVIPIFE